MTGALSRVAKGIPGGGRFHAALERVGRQAARQGCQAEAGSEEQGYGILKSADSLSGHSFVMSADGPAGAQHPQGDLAVIRQLGTRAG